MNKTKSKESHVTWGLPQGGKLSPILYLIYVNDIIKYNNNKEGTLTLFADDTSISFYHEDLGTLYSIANRELKQLNQWLEAHKLCINIGKTKFMLFSNSRTRANSENKIELTGIEIEKVENYKYLGCIIDNNLKWSTHIKNIRIKLSQMVPTIYGIRDKISEKNKTLMYNALIKPRLEYAAEVYGKTTEANLKSLQTSQNKTIRILYNKRRTENVEHLLHEKNILKVEDIIFSQKLKQSSNTRNTLIKFQN